MSDDQDICGYEDTTTGKPCQHPAESCPVPSHDDPGAENPQGRDFTISEDDHDDILQAAREGFSKAGCARAAGVSDMELQRYLDEHDEFRGAFMRARHEGEKRLVTGALISDEHNVGPSGMEVDGQHARFLLSTSFDYIKTEKREVDADVDHSGDLKATLQVGWNTVEGDGDT